jgi:hypothetical protein
MASIIVLDDVADAAIMIKRMLSWIAAVSTFTPASSG